MFYENNHRNTLSKIIGSIIILILLIILILSIKQNKDKALELENLSNSLNDTLKIWKDKDSINYAKISLLETSKVNDFIKLQTKDKEIKELQKEVNNYKNKLGSSGSVTKFRTITNVELREVTKIDTLRIVNGLDKFPEYSSEINKDGWIVGVIVANSDSIKADLKVKNDYSVIIGEERQGLFKPKKPFVEVKNNNPYSETESLRTYRVFDKTKKSKFGLGPYIGIGLDRDFKFIPNIGIGINYTLIKL